MLPVQAGPRTAITVTLAKIFLSELASAALVWTMSPGDLIAPLEEAQELMLERDIKN